MRSRFDTGEEGKRIMILKFNKRSKSRELKHLERDTRLATEGDCSGCIKILKERRKEIIHVKTISTVLL